MKSLFKQGSSAVLAALVALLALSAAGTAQAAVYRGVFDPTYGPAFPDLGWRGEALFNVPGNCGVTIETVVKTNDPDCSVDGLAYVQEASVRFYDVANPGVDIAEITWGTYGGEAAASADGVDLFQLAFVDGALDQVNASLDVRMPVPLSEAPPPFFATFEDYAFGLAFVIDVDACQLADVACESTFYSGPVLSSFGPLDCDLEVDCEFSRADVIANPPTFVITQVPEPGTLALVAAALMAGGSLRARRRGR